VSASRQNVPIQATAAGGEVASLKLSPRLASAAASASRPSRRATIERSELQCATIDIAPRFLASASTLSQAPSASSSWSFQISVSRT
jgi:hypothetical protein